jgi:hypothetical protein
MAVATSGVMISNKRALSITGKVIAACVLRENYDVIFHHLFGKCGTFERYYHSVKGRRLAAFDWYA